MERLRIGALGAARITPAALVRPARAIDRVEVTAVAARDRARAERFAARQRIPRVHGSYEELLADPAVDAVYVPLPNSLHARWTLAALAAGKHVLCEKPFTSNAAEAATVAEAAAGSGLVVMEAFHWRYHPLAARAVEVVRSGELGEVRHVEATMCVPIPLPGDIRWQLDLAGGALMDVGSYTTHVVRTLAGEEPAVTAATAKLLRPGVDRWVRADLRFPSGVTGRTTSSMLSAHLLDVSASVVGSAGVLRIVNPIGPQYFHRFTVETAAGKRRERFERVSTYEHQLRAFAAAVLDGAPVLTPPQESVRNMAVIDDIYRAAGLSPRGAA